MGGRAERAVLVVWVSMGAVGFLCLLVLTLKRALLGRVRPGQHALWSCWSSRWATLGSNTVPPSGSDVGEGAYVAAHNAILKGENLPPGRRDEGAPTR